MSAKHRPTFLILFALVSALSLSCSTTGKRTAEDLVNRGKGEITRGDFDGAMADFTKAIKLNPKDAAAYEGYGGVKAIKGDLDGAIADFSKAVQLNPKDAGAHFDRGVA